MLRIQLAVATLENTFKLTAKNSTGTDIASSTVPEGRNSTKFRSLSRRVAQISLVACMLACRLFSQAHAQTPNPVERPLAAKKVSIGGELAKRINDVVENWLIDAAQRNPQMLGMFHHREKEPYQSLLPWSGEFAGKHLTACVEMLRLTDHEGLQAYTQSFVNDLIACQAEDGYLGPFPQAYRLSGWAPNAGSLGGDTWDAWGHYHIMLGLMAWYQRTGDAAALDCAKRIGDLLVKKFAGDNQTVLATRSPEMNQAIVHSLARLYDITGDGAYLSQAREIIAEFEMPGAGDYLRAGLNRTEFFRTPKPRWESLHPMLGLVEMYWIERDEQYIDAIENLWWSIVRFDRHNNGGFSSGEQAQGDPYHQGAIETCCTVAWMALSAALLEATHNPVVADELELSLLNQVQAMHSPDGRWCTYNTPMDGKRIPSTVDIAFQKRPGSEELNCCSVNAARGFGILADWALHSDARSFHLNYFGASKIAASIGDNTLVLHQRTSYPLDNKIIIDIQTEGPVDCHGFFRIPHWSKSTTVRVNGEELAAEAGKYLRIDRIWRNGDIVEIELDFTLRKLCGQNACADMISVYRGPLLLATDWAKTEPKYSAEFQSYGAIHAAHEASAWVEFDFEGDRIEWNGRLFDDAGKARVYIDEKFVDEVDQYGPKRDEPFQWKYEGLHFTKHLIRIEVAGESNDASSNTFVNVLSLEPSDRRPALSIDALRNAKSVVDDNGLRVVVLDQAGDEVSLVPFSEAGRNEVAYVSWFACAGCQPIDFSATNPSRTSMLAP